MTNVELALGKGTFVSDVELPGMAHVAILRSPHAHARITSIDTSAAEALEGVLYVMTGEEARSAMRPIPEAWNTREIGAKGVHWYVLTPDRVRYVGEAIAAVVAEDKYTATRARDLIDVSYEILPAVTDPEQALEPDSPLVEPDWGDNLLISRDWRAGDVEAALAGAKRVASGVARSQRITASRWRRAACSPPGTTSISSSPTGSRPRTRTRCGPSSRRRWACPRTASA